MKVELSYRELHAIDQALSIAASVYDTDAQSAPQPRVMEQFLRQAKEARDLAERVNKLANS